MAKAYERTAMIRLLNRMMTARIKLGFSKKRALLTTRGRKTGELHTTPVEPITEDGATWVVSPYGAVGWVHNVRHAGRLTLSRKRISQNHQVSELDPEQAAPILKMYLERVKFARPYFDVTVESSFEDLATEAERHPVFRLEHVH